MLDNSFLDKKATWSNIDVVLEKNNIDGSYGQSGSFKVNGNKTDTSNKKRKETGTYNRERFLGEFDTGGGIFSLKEAEGKRKLAIITNLCMESKRGLEGRLMVHILQLQTNQRWHMSVYLNVTFE